MRCYRFPVAQSLSEFQDDGLTCLDQNRNFPDRESACCVGRAFSLVSVDADAMRVVYCVTHAVGDGPVAVVWLGRVWSWVALVKFIDVE